MELFSENYSYGYIRMVFELRLNLGSKRMVGHIFVVFAKDEADILYARWGPIFWPCLRSVAQALTIKAVRGTVAIQKSVIFPCPL